MKTIAIVGAGKGLGLSIAKKFGIEGFNVALIARNSEKLSVLTRELEALHINAKAYVADLNDLKQLKQALGSVKADFGGIDVLEFSPYSTSQSFTQTLETTPESVMEHVNSYLLPAIQSVNEVLPDMQNKGEGAILFTTGLSAMFPVPFLANIGVALSGLRSYATNLSNALKESGVYVGHLSIGTMIAPGTEGDPDLIAETWYDMYQDKAQFEMIYPKDMKIPV